MALSSRSFLFATVLLCASLPGFMGSNQAQAQAADGHPARLIHGTCDALADVAFPLTGVGAEMTIDGNPVPELVPIGSPDTVPLEISETTLTTSLTELTRDPYAIVIYESDEAMDQAIACGNIGGMLQTQMVGMIMPGDELVLWLESVPGSPYVGFATLQSVEGGKLSVTILLADNPVGSS